MEFSSNVTPVLASALNLPVTVRVPLLLAVKRKVLLAVAVPELFERKAAADVVSLAVLLIPAVPDALKLMAHPRLLPPDVHLVSTVTSTVSPELTLIGPTEAAVPVAGGP
jgi:hypothetical protein